MEERLTFKSKRRCPKCGKVGFVRYLEGSERYMAKCTSCGYYIEKDELSLTTLDKTSQKDRSELVVHCRDCIVPHNKWTGCPKLNGTLVSDDDFCSYGIRKKSGGGENGMTFDEMVESIKGEDPELAKRIELAKAVAEFLFAEDYVDVVRCRDCKNRGGPSGHLCQIWASLVPDTGFCYEGERKDDD